MTSPFRTALGTRMPIKLLDSTMFSGTLDLAI